MQENQIINVAAIVGSIRTSSYNQALLRAIQDRSPKNLNITNVNISALPMFNQDFENNEPSEVVEFKETIKHADAFLFVTPEYNRSLPPLMKNAIDWGSRPRTNNSWGNKPAAISGIGGPLISTFSAQSHLHLILSELSVFVMPTPYLALSLIDKFDDDGVLTDDTSIKQIDTFLDSFEEWLKVFLRKRN